MKTFVLSLTLVSIVMTSNAQDIHDIIAVNVAPLYIAIEPEPESAEPLVKIVRKDRFTEPALLISRVVIDEKGNMIEVTEFHVKNSLSSVPVTRFDADVFPDQSTEYVNIQMRNKYSGQGTVLVYDTHGVLVENMLFRGSFVSMEFADKKPGTYLMQLNSVDGKIKGTYKIIKKA